MSIIVEGCDGTGKTTLIQRLQYDFENLEVHPRFATSVEGPLDNLATRVYDDRYELSTGHWIYDRHPVISEYVYGQLIPERTIDPDFLTAAMGEIHNYVAREAFVIWCIPPFDLVAKNVEAEKQMPGVIENLRKIYTAYQIKHVTWPGYYNTLYDYSRPQSYRRVYEMIKAYYYEKGTR
jgi:GTPase SAR1 family protein